jgi:hypothetical protein
MKYNYEQVKKSFENEGYTLLSTEYNGCYDKLSFICPNGHEHQITWAKWVSGQRCGKCSGNIRYSIEQIKKSFEKEGYTLLSTEYKNSRQKISFICPNGHEHKITWDNWKQGYRCGKCSNLYNINIDFVKKSFEKEGYTLLSTKYKNAHQYLKFICSNGHEHQITWNNWKLGKRCGKCDTKYNVNYDIVKTSFEKEGYTLLSTEYENAHQYLKFICPNGHKHQITWFNWNCGVRCGKCDIKWSKGEKEIVNYIKTIYSGPIKENDRTQIINPLTGKYLELDIYLPELNKAIEYNSIYYHTNQQRDEYKQIWCKENNIDLLVIHDELWRTNKDYNQIKKFIEGET